MLERGPPPARQSTASLPVITVPPERTTDMEEDVFICLESEPSNPRLKPPSVSSIFGWEDEYCKLPEWTEWDKKNNLDILTKLMDLFIKYTTLTGIKCLYNPKEFSVLKKIIFKYSSKFYYMFRKLELQQNDVFLQKLRIIIAKYIDAEISSSRNSDQKVFLLAETVINVLISHFDGINEDILKTIMHCTHLTTQFEALWNIIFRKFLKESPSPESVSTQILHILAYKIWRIITKEKHMKKSIKIMAEKSLKLPSDFLNKCTLAGIIPKILPKVPENFSSIVSFFMEVKCDFRTKSKIFLKICERRSVALILDGPSALKNSLFDAASNHQTENAVMDLYDVSSQEKQQNSVTKIDLTTLDLVEGSIDIKSDIIDLCGDEPLDQKIKLTEGYSEPNSDLPITTTKDKESFFNIYTHNISLSPQSIGSDKHIEDNIHRMVNFNVENDLSTDNSANELPDLTSTESGSTNSTILKNNIPNRSEDSLTNSIDTPITNQVKSNSTSSLDSTYTQSKYNMPLISDFHNSSPPYRSDFPLTKTTDMPHIDNTFSSKHKGISNEITSNSSEAIQEVNCITTPSPDPEFTQIKNCTPRSDSHIDNNYSSEPICLSNDSTSNSSEEIQVINGNSTPPDPTFSQRKNHTPPRSDSHIDNNYSSEPICLSNDSTSNSSADIQVVKCNSTPPDPKFSQRKKRTPRSDSNRDNNLNSEPKVKSNEIASNFSDDIQVVNCNSTPPDPTSSQRKNPSRSDSHKDNNYSSEPKCLTNDSTSNSSDQAVSYNSTPSPDPTFTQRKNDLTLRSENPPTDPIKMQALYKIFNSSLRSGNIYPISRGIHTTSEKTKVTFQANPRKRKYVPTNVNKSVKKASCSDNKCDSTEIRREENSSYNNIVNYSKNMAIREFNHSLNTRDFIDIFCKMVGLFHLNFLPDKRDIDVNISPINENTDKCSIKAHCDAFGWLSLTVFNFTLQLRNTECYIDELKEKFVYDYSVLSSMYNNMTKTIITSPHKDDTFHEITLLKDFKLLNQQQKALTSSLDSPLCHLIMLLEENNSKNKSNRCPCLLCTANEIVLLTNFNLLQKIQIISKIYESYVSVSNLFNRSRGTEENDREGRSLSQMGGSPPSKKRCKRKKEQDLPSYPAFPMMSIAHLAQNQNKDLSQPGGSQSQLSITTQSFNPNHTILGCIQNPHYYPDFKPRFDINKFLIPNKQPYRFL